MGDTCVSMSDRAVAVALAYRLLAPCIVAGVGLKPDLSIGFPCCTNDEL